MNDEGLWGAEANVTLFLLTMALIIAHVSGADPASNSILTGAASVWTLLLDGLKGLVGLVTGSAGATAGGAAGALAFSLLIIPVAKKYFGPGFFTFSIVALVIVWMTGVLPI